MNADEQKPTAPECAYKQAFENHIKHRVKEQVALDYVMKAQGHPEAIPHDLTCPCDSLRQENERLRAEKTAAIETVVSLSAACDRLREKLTTAKAEAERQNANARSARNDEASEISTVREYEAAAAKEDAELAAAKLRIAELEEFTREVSLGPDPHSDVNSLMETLRRRAAALLKEKQP